MRTLALLIAGGLAALLPLSAKATDIDNIGAARAALEALVAEADQASNTEDAIRDALAVLALKARLGSRDASECFNSGAEVLQTYSFPIRSFVETHDFAFPSSVAFRTARTRRVFVPQAIAYEAFPSTRFVDIERQRFANRFGRRVVRTRNVEIEDIRPLRSRSRSVRIERVRVR